MENSLLPMYALVLTNDCFFGRTSFLPSSFSMYAMSLASGLFLLDKPTAVVAMAAFGVILGWPFSILTFFPMTLYSLSRKIKWTFIVGAVTSVILLALLIVIDFYYYGRWTSSILNLLIYNIVGGGESHLYGTEGVLAALSFFLGAHFHGGCQFCYSIYITIPIKTYLGSIIWLSDIFLSPEFKKKKN